MSDLQLHPFSPPSDLILKAQQEIADHEATITVLQKQLDVLILQARRIEDEKKKHISAIIKCRSLLTLASRLPGELLARIFEYAVQDGWTRGPIVVSQVCSSWREAAKMPSVWSHVYIDCDKGDPVARCELWLQMARQSPLCVTFRTSEYRPKVEAAFSSILSRIDYWRTLVLEVPSIYTINRLLERIISTGPLLQSISIKLGGSPVDDLLPDIVQGQARLDGFRQAFANALGLRRISFQTDTAQSWCGVSQITSLELQLNDCQLTNARPIFFSEIFDVLSESPNLRRLTINISLKDKREVIQDTPIRIVTLPEMDSLTLNIPVHFMAFLQHFRTPKLRKLYLRSPDDPQGFADETTRAALCAFIDLCAPPLETLELYDVDISQDDFLFWFTSLSSLIELRLHGSDILDETLIHLKSPFGLLPNLRFLDLRWCGHISGITLEELAYARSSVCGSGLLTPLSEITVINCSFVNEKHILGISNYSTCRLKVHDDNDFCGMSNIVRRVFTHDLTEIVSS